MRLNLKLDKIELPEIPQKILDQLGLTPSSTVFSSSKPDITSISRESGEDLANINFTDLKSNLATAFNIPAIIKALNTQLDKILLMRTHTDPDMVEEATASIKTSKQSKRDEGLVELKLSRPSVDLLHVDIEYNSPVPLSASFTCKLNATAQPNLEFSDLKKAEYITQGDLNQTIVLSEAGKFSPGVNQTKLQDASRNNDLKPYKQYLYLEREFPRNSRPGAWAPYALEVLTDKGQRARVNQAVSI